MIVQNQRSVGVVTDPDILAQARADIDDLRTVPVAAVISPCGEPLRDLRGTRAP